MTLFFVKGFMKMKILFILLIIVIVPVSPAVSVESTFSAVVTRIIDGDSIVVKKGKKYIEIRMYGIDCPEWNEHFSIEARNHTSALLYKQKITITPQYYDSYGRLVALLSKEGKDINGELVKLGFAWVYPKYCHKNMCKTWLANQQLANDKGIGVWTTVP